MEDDIICTEKIIAERKTFFLDLKQNARGKVVRITEKVSSNRDRIMVPAEILDDFIAALQDLPSPFFIFRSILHAGGTGPEC